MSLPFHISFALWAKVSSDFGFKIYSLNGNCLEFKVENSEILGTLAKNLNRR